MPQGSILGLLFFIKYINDIVWASNIFDFIIYADDTTLLTTLEIDLRNTETLDTESKLNSELANVSNWLQLNILSLMYKNVNIWFFIYIRNMLILLIFL